MAGDQWEPEKSLGWKSQRSPVKTSTREFQHLRKVQDVPPTPCASLKLIQPVQTQACGQGEGQGQGAFLFQL